MVDNTPVKILDIVLFFLSHDVYNLVIDGRSYTRNVAK
jgi:hypothetical protein